MQGWLSILLMIALGAGFALISVLLSSVLGPSKPTAEKSAPYECGMPPVGDARERQSVKFYLVAMIFLLFDIEVAFLYPWAMALRSPRVERVRPGAAVHGAAARRLRVRLAEGRARLGRGKEKLKVKVKQS
jgi:NADH-quinone oxidoreductase subunit A